jgi:inorganic pyrophosphatase
MGANPSEAASPVFLVRPGGLTALEPYDDDQRLRAVIETPRGSSFKLKYEPKLGTFEFGRSLPIGVTYPYDWGFIPGTVCDDGDPLDVLVVHESSTFPGVLLPCRLIGVVQLSQKTKRGREDNPRLIAVPAHDPRVDKLEQLPQKTRDEIAQFFVTVVMFGSKKVRLDGWAGPRAAERLVEQGRKACLK